jgi:hypothetical protein
MPHFIPELKRSAAWSAALAVPIFLLGLFLFDAHGTHVFQFTGALGLAIILPWAAIHDSGLSYHLGLGALPLIFLGQWAWCFLPVYLLRLLITHVR